MSVGNISPTGFSLGYKWKLAFLIDDFMLTIVHTASTTSQCGLNSGAMSFRQVKQNTLCYWYYSAPYSIVLFWVHYSPALHGINTSFLLLLLNVIRCPMPLVINNDYFGPMKVLTHPGHLRKTSSNIFQLLPTKHSGRYVRLSLSKYTIAWSICKFFDVGWTQ